MSLFTVVYDACVLYPAPVRDFLMQLATTGLFRACWTDAIHEEWMRSVLSDRPDLSREQLQRTRELMDSSAIDSLVTDYEQLVPMIELPRGICATAVSPFPG